MNRAFLRKVKSVSCPPSDTATAGQPEQALVGVGRRKRTSAAMIGLALSMGASSLLLPRQNDGVAAAAESKSPDATAIATATPSASVQHIVRKGQTLWQIARRYQVNVETLAAANGITSRSVLTVGQTLRIPVSQTQSASIQVEDAKSVAAINYPLIASADVTSSGSHEQVSALTEGRNDALVRLQQKREELRGSLASLRQTATSPVAAKGQVSVSLNGASKPSAKANGMAIAELPTSASPTPVASAATVRAIAAQPQVVAHQVRPGETVESLAQSYGVPQQAIVAANHLPDPDWLRINQSLAIPSPQSPSHPISQSPAQSAAETPAGVAPVTVISSLPLPIAEETPLPPNQVAVRPSTPEVMSYRVGLGDTVAQIARAHNVSPSELISANRLSDPNVIFVGQVLRVPAIRAVSPSSFANNSSSSVGRGGSAPLPQLVATAPSSVIPETLVTPSVPVSPEAASRSSDSELNSNVEGLLAEIKTLRQRYQTQSVTVPAGTAQAQPTTTVVPVPVAITASATTSGTAFNPNRANLLELPAAQQRPQALNSPTRTESSASTPSVVQSELVATAPVGSESYAPLLQPIAGRMVSPDLPPLSGASAYLPDSAAHSDGYIWPARGLLTSGFGWRWGRMHQGIDIAADIGTPVHAAADGVVEYAGWNSGGYGNLIEVRHADGSMTRYAHLNRIMVQVGQNVTQGIQIAEMGSTGYSTGPHLHFEVHLPSQGTVNPIAYLPQQ